MPHRDRRKDERGAVAVFLAIILVVVLGFGAFVLDVGALVQERRELQNGADAGALAVAKDCAGSLGCAGYGFIPQDRADDFVDANALDLDSNVDDVCGTDTFGILLACTDPPAVPEGVQGYVRVVDSTQEVSTGASEITFSLGQVLGLTGATVDASAVAAWGAVGSATTIPLTFSQCELDLLLAAGGGVQEGPPFSGDPQTILFHTNAESCVPTGNSSGSDLSGGFGWLDADDNCQTEIENGDTVGEDPGASADNSCDPSEWVNRTLLIPIYDQVSDQGGQNGEYHVVGFAAFYLTGYRFPGDTSPPACDPPDTCITGYFTTFVTGGGEFGTCDLPDPQFCAVTVKMVG